MTTKSHFLIAATASGSGKTTLTLGLLRALRNRGFLVQPFKCGPDYIDTKYHDLASGNKSYNLDLFMSSNSHIKSLYDHKSVGSDICVTEGVMGLFDGYDRMNGSSAQIAEILNIPIILVINAKSMAYSAAAMLYGFKNFHKEINVAGAIFNFVSSESHYNFLKEACSDVGIEALGYLPKNTDIAIPSRHLGLNIDEEFVFDNFANRVAEICEEHINIDKLLELTIRNLFSINPENKTLKGALKIAIAKDEAFNFIYHENIDILSEKGEIIYFSPLYDTTLPSADLVYLPGGYPELYLEELSNNKAMHNAIRQYVENGGKLLAECGGMMYLSNSIGNKDGQLYPMVGIFDQDATMQNMKLKLGYRQFKYNKVPYKGHEFHYSSLNSSLDSIAQLRNAKGRSVDTKLLRYKNAIAGYTHIYWGDNKNILDIFNK